MKISKKALSTKIIIIVFILMLLPAINSFAYKYKSGYEQAKVLYDLELYKGISDTSFEPDLDSTLDRQTAAIMIVRLFGFEDESLSMDIVKAKTKLKSKFKDADLISDWAAKQLAFAAIDMNAISGFTDGTFQPNNLITGRQYCTLILKMLGYNDFRFEQAGKMYGEVAGLNAVDEFTFTQNEKIDKSVLIGISYFALSSKFEGQPTFLIEKLLKDGAVDKQKYKKYMYMD